MLVHELIFQGEGNKIALHEKTNKFTYAQLQTRVAQYQDYLHKKGVRPLDNVALFAKNSADFIFSYMAIASLGSIVVPLNTLFTPREINFILKDARVKHIVTDKELQLSEQNDDGSISPVQILIPQINENFNTKADFVTPAVPIQDSDICVILYTSGTTGRPKGAMLSHKNLISNAESFSKELKATSDDKFLCVLPMFHSLAWTCIVLSPLSKGASITIVETFSPKEVIAIIRTQGINVVFGVPAMYNFYTSLAKPEDLAGVRLFISGGASLPMEIIDRFYAKTNQRIIEGYGLSEASPVVSFNPIHATKQGSIGLPIPGVKVMIVDNEGKELDPREIGELIVQGPNVMSGYYGLPVETTEAIRDGWLYTGDLAYKDEDSYIYIVDRKKDMVIVSGLKVYPREVEEILYQYPAVKEAAVIGVPNKKRGETVHAFLVVKEGVKINRKDLMSFLKANLASFKLPRAITEMESLPKNATGKILKKELRQLNTL